MPNGLSLERPHLLLRGVGQGNVSVVTYRQGN